MKLIRSIVILLIAGSFFAGCAKEPTPLTPTPVVVNAGASQSIVLPIDSVTLTGTVVSGQNPELLYSWTLVVGPNSPTILNGNTTIATVKGLIAGTYIFQFAITSGTKTFTGLDTIKVSDIPTLTNTQLLTEHLWEPQVVSFQISGTQYNYTRGGASYVPYGDDFDHQRFAFYPDGTGLLIGSPNDYPFTWVFAPGDETKMTVIINYGTKVLTFNWSSVVVTQNSLIYAQEYVDGGIEVLSQNLYVPVYKTELLTQHVWEPQQVSFQISGTQYHYTRGGANNFVPSGDDFDDQRFTFYSNGTGLLAGSPANYPFTWAFTPGDETKMTVIINYGTKVLTFNWSSVVITPNSLNYAQEYVDGGVEVLSQNLYVPTP